MTEPELPGGIRPATADDVATIHDLICDLATYERARDEVKATPDQLHTALIGPNPAAYALVAEIDGEVVGCGAVHVLWQDVAEIRTLAVSRDHLGKGVGGHLMDYLITDARTYGVRRLFCLTFEIDFFVRHGFEAIDGQAVDQDVYQELLRSYDEGVAEFLDLSYVKPNTLGNSRMLLRL